MSLTFEKNRQGNWLYFDGRDGQNYANRVFSGGFLRAAGPRKMSSLDLMPDRWRLQNPDLHYVIEIHGVDCRRKFSQKVRVRRTVESSRRSFSRMTREYPRAAHGDK